MRFNKMSREKHSTPLKYHNRIKVICWKRNSKALVVNIIGVPVKKIAYGYIDIAYQDKRYVYTKKK